MFSWRYKVGVSVLGGLDGLFHLAIDFLDRDRGWESAEDLPGVIQQVFGEVPLGSDRGRFCRKSNNLLQRIVGLFLFSVI